MTFNSSRSCLRLNIVMLVLQSAFIFLFLCTNVKAFVKRPPSWEVTYGELETLNVTCEYDRDNCKEERYLDSLPQFTCHCGNFCHNLRTCCVDSPWKTMRPTVTKASCTTIYGQEDSKFIVDRCPKHAHIYKPECESDHDEDDFLSFTPVTSLATNLTYKNYFCFKCNEAEHENYLFWNFKISSDIVSDKDFENVDDIIPTFDKEDRVWMAQLDPNSDPVNVTLQLLAPDEVTKLVRPCIRNVISECSTSWRSNYVVKRKCAAYTALVVVENGERVVYRNPHCALCNFESLENIKCYPEETTFVAFGEKKPFSFALLLDINRSGGDQVGKTKNCDLNSTWDPFFKKCRTLKCALPGYVMKEGKCTKV